MHITVLGTHPDTRRNRGRIGDEPSVGIVVGRSRLAGDGPAQTVPGTQPGARTAIHDSTHHLDHGIGGIRGNRFVAPLGELAQYVAVLVLDPGNEKRMGIEATGRKDIIGSHHLINGEVGGTHAQGDDRVDLGADSHLVHHRHHGLGPQLLHQPGGDGVGTVGQPPLEVHHRPVTMRILRCPGAPVADIQHLRGILHPVAGGHSGFHRQGIEERLDGGTHLPLPLTDIVVFEIAVIRSAYIGPDVPGLGFDRHEGSPEERLVVTDGIVRCHHGVPVSRGIPGEHPHGDLLVKAFRDLGVGMAGSLHHAVAVAPAAGLLHVLFHDLVAGSIGERPVLPVAELPVEHFLEVLAQVLGDGFLGIPLHLVVDGRIDAESVLVQVILGTVVLEVLVQPAEKRVVGPQEGIGPEVLHGLISPAAGALGHHRPAEHVPEVRSHTGSPVDAAGMQFDGKGPEGIALLPGQVILVPHAPEDQVAALQRLVGIDGRVVAGGFVHHAHQDGAFLHLQVDGILAEEIQGGRLDAVGIGPEEDCVQVHVHDFLLGVVALQLDGRDPFAELDPDHVQFGGMFLTGVQGLRKLLGDGGTATLAGITGKQGLEQHAEKAPEIDAGMLVEPGVLRSDGRLDQVLRKFVIADERPVFNVIGRQDLAFFGDDLGSELGIRVFEFLQGRDLGKDPDDAQQQQDQGDRGQQEDPEPAGYLLFCLFRHSKKINLCTRP